VSGLYAYDIASSAALHTVGPTQSVRVTACNLEWFPRSPLASRSPPSLHEGRLDPPGGAALDIVSSREIPDKGLRNRWPTARLIVVHGSAEIL